MKKGLKVLKRNPEKCAEAGVNENKQTEYTKELMKENPCWKIHGDREQVQQCGQNNRRGPSLVGYVMWKLDTKLVA